MTVAGIDPSLSATGVAIITDDRQHDSCCFRSEKCGVRAIDRFDRHMQIINPLLEWLEVWKPQMIVIEDYAIRADESRNHHELIEFCWSVRSYVLCCDWVPELLECAPKTLKKFACGYGGSKKHRVTKDVIRAACLRHWGINFRTSDEMDSYVLARMAACITGIVGADQPIASAQRAALSALTGKNWGRV